MKAAGENERGPKAPDSIEPFRDVAEDVRWAARMAERQALGRLVERAMLAGCLEHFQQTMAARLPAGIQDAAVELVLAGVRGGFTPGGGCQ